MALIDGPMTALALTGFAVWAAILLLPWRPWRVAEVLEPAEDGADAPLDEITVLIPARNEAAVIGTTLAALARQGEGLRVIVIDDQSSDATPQIARAAGLAHLELIAGRPPPAGWSGKMWALEQGRGRAATPLLLLLDADIALDPGMIAALARRRAETGAALVSLMAWLRMESGWERLLMPAFVYFFRLLYPFRLANAPRSPVAAAAGGCVLVERRALEAIGGFAALSSELIDDCALARAVKRRGGVIWVGLTHGARSLRAYPSLGIVWQMVARTAFTQLHYSPALLAVATLALGLACWAPAAALVGFPVIAAKAAGGAGLVLMAAGYAPTLAFYRLPRHGAFAMPVAGTLFLAMTWSSAIRYWRGRRSAWKGRVYARHGKAGEGPGD